MSHALGPHTGSDIFRFAIFLKIIPLTHKTWNYKQAAAQSYRYIFKLRQEASVGHFCLSDGLWKMFYRGLLCPCA